MAKCRSLLQSGAELAVVTGTAGLAYEAASTLVQNGFRVVVAGRNRSAGEAAVRSIRSRTHGAQVHFEQHDLARLQSVHAFIAAMRARGDAIDVLLNNAGVMTPPARQTTAEGHEIQFGVNYLAHFALTAGLLPVLRAGARVVNVTSLAQHYARLELDKINDPVSYRAGPAYCTSKLLQAMFAVELQQRSDAAGWNIVSLAAHPGFASTNLFRGGQGHSNLRSLFFTKLVAPVIGQSPADGVRPIIHAATAPGLTGGQLFGPKGFKEMKGPPGECAFAALVYDSELRGKVWEFSEKLIGYRFGDGASQDGVILNA
jgi:NAD(P)-dependent dehydrogenase (short-subunit alcohol dehydrogenase family)